MNYSYLIIFIVFFCYISSPSFAKDLGTFGEVFEILEEDIIDVIHRKLSVMQRNGALEKEQQEIKKRISRSVRNPTAVEGIIHTVEERKYEYDPSIEVKKDILGLYGKIIHPAGTRLNPLDYVPLPCELLFIDGKDNIQILWAIDQLKKSSGKIILTSGSPIDLEMEYNIPFYFDQSGVYARKFGIQQVPARLYQKGRTLLIHELKPGVGGTSNE